MPGWVWAVGSTGEPRTTQNTGLCISQASVEAFPTSSASQSKSPRITALLKAFRYLSKTHMSKHCGY